MRPVSSFAEFRDDVLEALGQVTDGTELVVFPELFTSGLFCVSEGWENDSINDYSRLADFLDDYRELFTGEAARRGYSILAGSTLARTERGIENVAYLFGPDGSEFTHAKTHIFPAEGQWDTEEGNDFRITEVNGVKVGIAICYEAEIPEVATILSRKGADVIVVPSYTFTEAGFYRVRHCAAARAIENQVYMVHCPTVGELPAPLSPGRGRPSILSPCDLAFPANGILTEGVDDAFSVVSAVLDLDLLEENRKTGAATTQKDRARRAELYSRYRDFLY